MAMLPVCEGHPKKLRCPNRGAARVYGKVVCREHRPPTPTLGYAPYLRFARPI